ncbi:MAG: electron transfer flavoprotein subunit beta/FixA family protein [Thermoleophilaceae bacterium]
MKIVVPVKQVAVLDEEFELLDDRPGVDPDAVDWELNEWDDFSLETALQLREAEGQGEVVVISLGDEEAEEGLRACLAKGADRAQRVWEGSLEGADPLAVARVLAAAVERESPDLVLCGVQSSDAVHGATGVALAAHLGLPRVAVVNALDYDAASRSATVERELEGGLVELLRVELPALLTIQTGINEPRYANLRAIKQAKEKPLEVMELSDLGLDDERVAAAAGSRVRSISPPEAGGGAEMLNGSPAAVAERIAEIVKERMTG